MSDLSLVGSLPFSDSTTDPSAAFAVFALGNYAYVYGVTAQDEFALQIVNISDPTNPIVVGSYTSGAFSLAEGTSVVVVGQYAYVSGYTNANGPSTTGFQIIDISNPAAPSLVGSFTTTGGSGSVAVSGDYAYVNDFNNGAVRIVDVSNPGNPTLVGTYLASGNPSIPISYGGPAGYPFAVAVFGHYLYVGDWSSAIEIVDVSNPTSPVLVGTYMTNPFPNLPNLPAAGTPYSPTGFAISGHYLYVADQDNGLYILDVSNPTAPSLVGTYDPGGADHARFAGVQVVGNSLYLTELSPIPSTAPTGAVLHLDISNPTNPILVSQTSIGALGEAGESSLSVSGGYVYVADNLDGLKIFEIGGSPPIIDTVHSVVMGTVNELANTTGSSALDSPSPGNLGNPGTIVFTDSSLATTTATVLPETVVYTDANGNAATLTAAEIAALEQAFSIALMTSGSQGTIDWTYSIPDNQLDFLGVGETVTLTAPVQINDGQGDTVTQNVVITIYGANDIPVATPDTATVQVGHTLSASVANGVLSMDSDPDIHDVLQITTVRFGGTTDTVTGNQPAVIHGTYGTLTLNADGSYTYVETADHIPRNGAQDVFTYTVSDGHGGTATSKLTIGVSVSAPPVVHPDDSATIQMGGTLTADAAHGVLADPNNNSLTVSAVDGSSNGVHHAIAGAYGNLTLNGNGSYTYVETSTSVPFGAQDVFTYTVSDGHGGTAVEALHISVTAAPSGTLANAIETAEAMINVQHGAHVTDASLISTIASDLAVQFNSTGTYTIYNGYITPDSLLPNPKSNGDFGQCAVLVQALDPSVGLTGEWTSGGQQVDLGGASGVAGFNPNIAEGTPIATLVKNAAGLYVYPSTNEHAAIFLGYGVENGQAGFFVLDQWFTPPGQMPAGNPPSEPAEVRFIGYSTDHSAAEYYTIVPHAT